MRLNLPFTTGPKYTLKAVGTETTGVLMFPSRNALTVKERAYIDAATDNLPDVMSEYSKLAVKMAHEQNMGADKAFEALTSKLDDESNADLKIRYIADIVEVNKKVTESERIKKFAGVTAIMPRLAIPLKEELKEVKANAGNNGTSLANYASLEEQIKLLENWDENNSKELSEDLFNEIWKFFELEMNGGKLPEPMATTPTSEEVGKPPEESNGKKPTGAKSSGESEPTGQKIPVSSPTASASVK